MALKNRDLLFIIKVRNEAKAALAGLRGDLKGVGSAAQQGNTGLKAQERQLDSLAKKANLARAAIERLNRAQGGTNSIRDRAREAGQNGNPRPSGGGRGGQNGPDNALTNLAKAAREAAAALVRVNRNGTNTATVLQRVNSAGRAAAGVLDRIGRSRNNRGNNDADAAARATAAALRTLTTSANRAAAALDRISRQRGSGGGGGAGAGAAAGAVASRGIGLGGLLAGGAVVAAAREYAQLSDEYKSLYARVSLTTKGVKDQEQTFQRVVNVANSTRNGLEGTVVTYYRMAQAGKTLGLEQDKVFRATELVSKAVTISGASAEAAKGALIQLGQGLGSGTLRGEELNSVLEQTPRLAEALAAGLGYKSVQALKALGTQGKLTSEQVINALLSQGAVLDKEFGQFPVTIGQAFTVLRNGVQVAIGEIEKSSGVTAGFANAILQIGLALQDPTIMEGLKSLISGIGQVARIIAETFVGALNIAIALMPVLKVGLALVVGQFIFARVAAAGTGTAIAGMATKAATALYSIGFATVATVRGMFAPLSLSIAAITGRATLSVRAMSIAVATSARAMRTALNAAFGILGTIITLMLAFSDSTIQVGKDNIRLGDIVAETWSQFIGWISGMIDQLTVAWSTISAFFGSTKAEGKNTSSGLVSFFTSAINLIIASFLTLGQTVGIILGNILAKIVLTATAMKRFLSGDFAGAQQAFDKQDKIGIVSTVKQIGANAQKNYSTDYAGNVLKGAAARTAKNQQDPLGGIGRDPTGKDFEKAAKDGKKAKDAAKELANALKSLQDTYDPLRAKTREYNETVKKLAEAAGKSDAELKKLGYTHEDIERIARRAKEVYEEETNILFEGNKAIREATRELGVSAEQRDIETKIIELENKARENNVELTAQQVAGYRRELEALRALTAADEARQAIKDGNRDIDAEVAGIGKIGAARERAVQLQQFANKLIIGGVAADTKRYQELVAAYDQMLSRKAAVDAANDFNDRIKGLSDEIRLTGVLEQQRDRAAKILEYENYLREQGVLDTAEGVRYMQQYVAALDEAKAAEAAARADWRSGIREGLQELTQQWTDFRSQAKQTVMDVFTTLNDQITGLLSGKGFNFKAILGSLGGNLIKTGVNGVLGQVTGGLDKLLGTSIFGKKDDIKPTSILDKYLVDGKAIPVIVQNAQALGLGGENPTGGILGSLLGGGGVQPGATAGTDTIAAAGKTLTGGLDGAFKDIVSKVGAVGGSFTGGFGGILQGILGSLGGGGGGILSGLLGGGGGGGLASLASAFFADGGIMTSRGKVPLRTYSGGGIASSPQLAMFGEGSVPEAYVPVPSGRIPVEMRGNVGGGSVTNVNMNVHANDANSFRKSRGQMLSELGGEIARQSRRNG